MSTNSAGFVGNIPSHYDAGLGPNIFTDYADRLAARCAEEPVAKAIELAAGTGILSRKLCDVLPSEAQVLISDLNAPMLEVAKAKFSAADNVEFAVVNAMDLPFEDGAFDLITCQFGVMFFPDKPASFHEAARVLRPGGRYVFNVWSPMSENPFSQVAHDVGAHFFPQDPPGFYKVPFHYGDPEAVRADLRAAGWTDIEHETIRLTKTIVNPEAFAHALVFGNPLVDEIRERGGVDPTDVAARMLSELKRVFGPQGMTMPLSATTFVCRKT
ncbi:class I SAM-dependent methyltransferase [Ruegeria arenilitoris]|uniref:class I SAM-dependent methyltransferase n=1 Tax=Ruegeria arenilitoris TaxID=1173585 RepID=UPI00147D77B8|nr:class I SAM-dependent methyltransferase [Ruegeria arenilitoris]